MNHPPSGPNLYFVEEDQRGFNLNDLVFRSAQQQPTSMQPNPYAFYPTTPYLHPYQQAPPSSVMPDIQPRQPTPLGHPMLSPAQHMYSEQAIQTIQHQLTHSAYQHMSDEDLSKHQQSPPPSVNERKPAVQSPPSSSNSPSPGSSLTKEARAKKRARGNYNCSRCGGQKKGHQCTTTQISEEELRKLHETIHQLRQRNAFLEQELGQRDELIASLREKERDPVQRQQQRHLHPPAQAHPPQQSKRRDNYNKK